MLFRAHIFFASLAVIFAVAASPAMACKYSVRDVAFVELTPQPYRLSFAHGVGVSADHLKWASAASSQLLNSNVVFGEPMMIKDTVSINMALRAPDDRNLVLLDDSSANIDEDAIWAAFREIVTSPVRDEVFEHLLARHSVVLVIEGADAATNQRAAEMAGGAVKTTTDGMDKLPKPAGGPPHIITIANDKRAAERVLLFSLGVEQNHPDDAHIVLLMGRGRKLGPVLTVPGTTQMQIATNLSYVGADCECELDRSWMQGTMVPHVWGEEDEAAALKSLGFDPGNALVKSEIHRILLRGPGGEEVAGEFNPQVTDPLLGYEEIELAQLPATVKEAPVNDGAREDDEQDDAATAADAAVQPPAGGASTSNSAEDTAAAAGLGMAAILLFFIGGIAVIFIICGVAMYALRAGRIA